MRNVYHVNHIIHQLALHFNILRHVDIPQCADMPHSPLPCSVAKVCPRVCPPDHARLHTSCIAWLALSVWQKTPNSARLALQTHYCILCQPGLLPLGNHVKIRLEPVDVVLVSNMSMQNTVVCEQTDCTVGDAIR